jgi:NAD(P)-dependent dehydrogenase (short-subunit alcohol dehydrogenase family)
LSQRASGAGYGRWGEPRAIAGLALYLASDAASYATGAALTADRGWSVH